MLQNENLAEVQWCGEAEGKFHPCSFAPLHLSNHFQGFSMSCWCCILFKELFYLQGKVTIKVAPFPASLLTSICP